MVRFIMVSKGALLIEMEGHENAPNSLHLNSSGRRIELVYMLSSEWKG
jgi:hypothetical protein